MISQHTHIRSLVALMIEVGWQPDWIILEPNLGEEDGSRPDFALLIGTYPIASLEIVKRGQSADDVRKPQMPPADSTSPQGRLFPCRLESDGTVIWNSSNILQRWVGFPTPQELWELAGNTWNEGDDPRLIAGRSGLLSYPMTLHQCIAMGKILDAQLQGQRRVYAVMPTGAGGTAVALEATLRLLYTRRVCRALILSNNSALAIETEHRLHQQKHFPVHRLESDKLLEKSKIDISTTIYVATQGGRRLADIDSERYDLLVFLDLRPNHYTRRILRHFEQARSIGILTAPNVSVGSSFGRAVYARQAQDILDEINLQPPHGMRMVRLGEIASISAGVVRSRGPMEEPVSLDSGREVLVIHARDIPQGPDGSVEPGPPELVHTAMLENGELVPGDIVMPRISNSVQLRIGVINFHGSYASSQIIRIRTSEKNVSPADVFQHLRSSEALFYLRVVSSRLQASLRITAVDLADMPIFLPDEQSGKNSFDTQLSGNQPPGDQPPGDQPPGDQPPGDSQLLINSLLAGLARRLNDDILPALRVAGSVLDPDPESLIKIAGDLQNIAHAIVPRTLDDRILLDYPTPISLAWRRYRDARFNLYEQVLRLRDAFEAAAFFVYNLMLADALSRLDENKYRVVDNGARKAWKGASMAARMDFVGILLDIASANSAKDLFMPGLVGTSVVAVAKRLQSDFRNRLSHSSTASESRLRALLDEFEPEVEDMMDGLTCLTEIQLVRIPSFFFRDGIMVRRIEIYRGVVPQVAEQGLSLAFPKAVEHDHLVLLDADERTLDLYPLYQLIENKATQHERHICFMKQVRSEKECIMGESSHSPIELVLDGYSRLSEMVRTKGF
jgi:hypothetical protein